MFNQTEAARQAQRKMDERFVALQAVHKRMDEVRATGARVEFALYHEWERAYQQFQEAHEEWKAGTSGPVCPPPN